LENTEVTAKRKITDEKYKILLFVASNYDEYGITLGDYDKDKVLFEEYYERYPFLKPIERLIDDDEVCGGGYCREESNDNIEERNLEKSLYEFLENLDKCENEEVKKRLIEMLLKNKKL
jgi:hypothetical protein